MPYDTSRRQRRFMDGRITLTSVFITIIVVTGLIKVHINDDPTMMAPQIQVDYFSANNLSVSFSRLEGKFWAGFNITNPYKNTDISIRELRVSIRHRHVKLAQVVIEPKEKESSEVKRMEGTIVMVQKAVNKLAKHSLEKMVFEKIKNELSSGRRVVHFDLEIRVIGRLHAGDYPAQLKVMNYACDHVPVVFSGNNTVDGLLEGVNFVPHDCHYVDDANA